ncbi:MAG: hypothetical protein WAK29_12840, partial [Terriglobales bacterium]
FAGWQLARFGTLAVFAVVASLGSRSLAARHSRYRLFEPEEINAPTSIAGDQVAIVDGLRTSVTAATSPRHLPFCTVFHRSEIVQPYAICRSSPFNGGGV